MKIEIWSDFACPFCYIGKIRFEKALSRFEHKNQVHVVYKSFQLDPQAPKVMNINALQAHAKQKKITLEQAKSQFERATNMGKSVGLDFQFESIQLTNTYDAHRVAKWANIEGKESVMTQRLMKAYFTDGLNLSDPSVLQALSSEVGLDQVHIKELLESTQLSDVVDHQLQEAIQLGIEGVPSYIFNRTYAINGAQEEEYFLAAIEEIWEELYEPSISSQPTDMCDGDSCKR
jgi:predicted DsbA family dithiol-disulfide isomerase